MGVTINFVVPDEFDAQIELMCKLNSTTKYKWIRGLIREEMAVFFQNYKQEEMRREQDKKERDMRKSWALDDKSLGGNRQEVGITHVFPPAY